MLEEIPMQSIQHRAGFTANWVLLGSVKYKKAILQNGFFIGWF